MGTPVVHFEIGSTDLPPLLDFYRELLGWEIAIPPDMDGYALVNTKADRGVNGGIAQGDSSYVTFYVLVGNLEATLSRAEQLGGKVVVPVQTVPGVVTFASFSDPQGNLVGLVLDDGTTPPERTTGSGAPVTHFEITGAPLEPLLEFYRSLFGWEIDADNPMRYGVVAAQAPDTIGGGIGESQDGGPTVTFYAEVPDIAATLAKAVELGGSVVVPVTEVPGVVTFAQFADPQGHVIGLAKSE